MEKDSEEEKARELLVATRRKNLFVANLLFKGKLPQAPTIGMLLDFKISGVYLFYCIHLIYEKPELEVSRNDPLFQSEGSAFFPFLLFFFSLFHSLSSWPT